MGATAPSLPPKYVTSFCPRWHLAGFAVNPTSLKAHDTVVRCCRFFLTNEAVDYDVINVCGHILVVQLQQSIHQLLEHGCGLMQSKQHGDKLV